VLAHGRIDLLQVDVVDPLGEALDDLDVVAVGVGDVPGVQAQVHEPRIGVGQEPLDLVLGLDVGVHVRVEDQFDAELLVDHPAEFVGSGDEVAPVLGAERRGVRRLARVHVGVLLGQVDQVLGTDGGEQPRLAAERLDRRLERLGALVQGREDGAAAHLQAALVQFVAQPLRILRKEALRAEFGPHVAGPGQFVEVLLPGHLVRVRREPHAPRVRGGAEREAGVGGHSDPPCGVRYGRWMALLAS
jgi:hypothetical protein